MGCGVGVCVGLGVLVGTGVAVRVGVAVGVGSGLLHPAISSVIARVSNANTTRSTRSAAIKLRLAISFPPVPHEYDVL